jgi:hypothetical protein
MAACIAASAAAFAASVPAFTAILCMRAALDFAAPMKEDLDFRADDLFFLFFATNKLPFRRSLHSVALELMSSGHRSSIFAT